VITQSGETADTLARCARRSAGARSIAICNVVGSMATREADGTVYTHAGPRSASRRRRRSHRSWSRCNCWRFISASRGTLPPSARSAHRELDQLPLLIETALHVTQRSRSRHASTSHRDFLYLGRGINYPIALEGALKLKEISYIHAKAIRREK
jgi:glucosamine--fructose-6-phosphate aminotransferase (isomerizing)